MTDAELENGRFQLAVALAESFADRGFRSTYMEQHLRQFLADQVRGLRGDMSQAEFGRLIGKPQSVVSRIEDEDGRVSLQTLVDVAQRLDIGLIVRFVDYPTFLRETSDMSENATVPQPFAADQMNRFITEMSSGLGINRDLGARAGGQPDATPMSTAAMSATRGDSLLQTGFGVSGSQIALGPDGFGSGQSGLSSTFAQDTFGGTVVRMDEYMRPRRDGSADHPTISENPTTDAPELVPGSQQLMSVVA